MDRREFMVGGAAATALASPLLAGISQAATDQTMAAGPGAGDAAAAAYAELSAVLLEIERDWVGSGDRMRDSAERAAGRYLVANALQHGFHFWFEADPMRPMFNRWFSPTKKLLGDNPDAVYYGTVIDPSKDYRIRGNLHGATYTSFTVEGGTKGGGMSSRLVSAINDTEFDVAADGSYELILSATPQARNWLKLEPDAGSVTTRHYYEWERSAAADPTLHVPIWIEPLEDPGPAAPMNDEAVAAGIRRVIKFVRGVTIDMPVFPSERMPDWVSRKVNTFANPKSGAEQNIAIGYAAKDNTYRQTQYEIEADEALEIRGRFPRCRFANFMVWNNFMETPPYRGRRVSYNRNQIQYEDDGSFRIVVAHQDPGVPNWVDAAGARTGTAFWRFQLAEGEIPKLKTKLIPLSKVRA